MPKHRIIIVDDEEIMRSSLHDWLTEDGYDVTAVEDGFKAIEMVRNDEWDLALVDLKMPGIDGIDLLKRLAKIKPDLPVIIITAYATVDSAVTAIKEGAVDYLVKPFNPEELSVIISRVVEHQRVLKENILLRQELAKRFKFHDMVGKSPVMMKILEMIRTVAPSKSTVLIQGESGTGKELVARAIHELSPRRAGPFIAVACGAMPETLLEAELFGHEKGAFTGSVAMTKGRIELSDTGTLFLDEIGDISAKTQVDLLRFIQEREFCRLGSSTPIKVDVRIIAATHRNLEKMTKEEKFREDLFYRLNVITIAVPPLRDRKEDIPLLVDHFLQKISVETGKKITKISEDALKHLISHDWPGNIRQLQNALEHAAVISKGQEITLEALPKLDEKAAETRVAMSAQTLAELEKNHIEKVLKVNNWNIKKTAEILGINKITLYRKIKAHELKKP